MQGKQKAADDRGPGADQLNCKMWEKMIISDKITWANACLQLGPNICEEISSRKIQAGVHESDSEASSEDDLVLHGS